MKNYHHCVKFTYPLSFQTRIPKVDQHTGGKWLIHGTKHRWCRDTICDNISDIRSSNPLHRSSTTIENTYKIFPLSVYKSKTAFDVCCVRAVCKMFDNLQRITEDVSHHMCVLSSEHPPRYNCCNFYLRPSSFMNGPTHLSVYSSVHPSVCVSVRRTCSEINLHHQQPGKISAKHYNAVVSDALMAWQCV